MESAKLTTFRIESASPEINSTQPTLCSRKSVRSGRLGLASWHVEAIHTVCFSSTR